jgi:hypothetical protein
MSYVDRCHQISDECGIRGVSEYTYKTGRIEIRARLGAGLTLLNKLETEIIAIEVKYLKIIAENNSRVCRK